MALTVLLAVCASIGLGAAQRFPQSVASGDPTPSSVMLWTRVEPATPEAAASDLPVQLQISTQPSFGTLVQDRADLLARVAFDHCVKVRADGLDPYTTYYYRFISGGEVSPVGRTKTAPAPEQAAPVRFAVINCQDYIGRFYNTLAHLVLTESNQVDFVVHLGDYIYETTGDPSFQSGGATRAIAFADTNGAIRLGRADAPFYAAASLDNYRQLYRTYRSDSNLQRLHELFPVINIWDDHEFANDCWGANATDLTGRQVDSNVARRHNAEQAFFEYLPIASGFDGQGVKVDASGLYPNARIDRNFRFGSLVELFMTDYRSFRPDHLIPEDAFPGAVPMTEEICSGLLGANWSVARASFDPYVNLDGSSNAVLKATATAILTGAYQAEGLTLAQAQGRAAAAAAGPVSVTYLNGLFQAAGQPVPVTDLSTLPRGLSFVLLGKQRLFDQYGSRYLVPRDTFQLYAAYKGLSDPNSQNAYGTAQSTRLATALGTSTATWKVVGDSVSLTPLGFDFSHPPIPLPPGFPASLKVNLQLNADDWDGFPNGRQALLDMLAGSDAVVISGDIHGSFITRHNTSLGRIVPEFTTTSVSSETFREEVEAAALGNPATADLPGIHELVAATDLLVTDALNRSGQATMLGSRTDANGYLVLQATAQNLLADYRHIPAIYVESDQSTNASTLARICDSKLYAVTRSTNGLDIAPLDVKVKVGANLYSRFSTDLTPGSWVYIDADPLAKSPLRATQRSLGYREVTYKAAVYPTLTFNPVTPTTNGAVVTYDYSAQSAKTATVGFWAAKDLPIIVGPDGNAYITDGHHTTAGYLPAVSPIRPFIPGLNRVVLGHVVANYYNPLAGPQPASDAWWLARAAENNAYLYGTNGSSLVPPSEPSYAGLQPILPSQLAMPTTPSSVTGDGVLAMFNSPYRSLTWGLADGIVLSALDASNKKIPGYKKSAPGSSVDINFVEFYWGDFLRDRVVWDDTKTGSPQGAAAGDASVISAPLGFFAAVANGIALARSEVYRDHYGRRLTDYTNATVFSATTVSWAHGSYSNGLAKATDTYHLYLQDDSGINGDISPSALATNILHVNTSAGLTLSNALLNIRTLLINDGPGLAISWKDATVPNSTLRFPAGTGAVTLPGSATIATATVVSNGTFEVAGTLTSPVLTIAGGTLAGSGTVRGAVNVGPAGAIASAPTTGTLTIQGPLTLAGGLALDIEKNGGTLTTDRIVGVTSLNYGGVLKVIAHGSAPAAGDSFKLFDAATYDGAFAGYELPALDAGLAWDTSSLLADGTLRVGAAGATSVRIAKIPASMTAEAGTRQILTGGAVGSEPITYQWLRNGEPAGSPTNNASLVFAAIQKSQQGSYQLIAANASGSATSAPVVVTVNQAPVANPQSLDFGWATSHNFTLTGSDADGDAITFKLLASPTKGSLTGTAPNFIYHPALGAGGADSFTFTVNDGRVDAAAATVSISLRGFQNRGLVAVGRIPADSFDARGPGVDTLGGVGSAMCFDPATWSRSGDEGQGFIYSGTLYSLPDRGFGDGTQNYLPRVEALSLNIAPYYGAGPVAQNQITLSNTSSLLLTSEGVNFTGYDADDAASQAYPRSTAGSLGQGRRSLDPEGIVRLADGSFFISDEYGPLVYKFDRNGVLDFTLLPPAGILPKLGAFAGTNYFTATNPPVSGRRNNRGLEGLSLTPDGKRLFAMLQSPAMQDGGAGSSGRNTRVLVFDVDPASATYKQALAEYVYVLTLNGNAQTNRNTPVSEILALNREQFLVLERDSGLGLGTGLGPSTYKRIVLASTAGASNILNTPYDLEKGAPGQVSLPAATLPPDITPVQRFDFVDLLDPAQLARFGLNNSAAQDANTLSEKWEGLALVPLNDPAAPEDQLLLVMNDNDFKAPVVYHNGVVVGTNDVPVDTMMLAFRVALPAYGAAVPPNAPPQLGLSGPTNAVLSAPATFTLTAKAYDQDGRIVRVDFFSGETKLGEDTTYPFQLALTSLPPGPVEVRAVAFDNEGASSASAPYLVTIVAENLAPAVAITSPANGSTLAAPANFTLGASAADIDGWITRVVFHRGSTAVATNTSAPFQVSLSSQPLGAQVYSVVATDNQGISSTSAPVSITVLKNTTSAALTLQILHASDLEAGIDAVIDAPAFSSVLAALKAQYPTNTLVLSSGDNYIPGPFFNAAGDAAAGFNLVAGRADIAMLNAMGFQAAAFGNHEFDAGTPQVNSLLGGDTVAGYAGTKFPYLSANLDFAPDSSLRGRVTADGQNASALGTKIARSCVITVGGQLVGIVGATTPALRSISSPGSVAVNTNVAAAVQAAVDALLPLGVNKVIVLAHLQQYQNEFTLAQQLRDVDVVVAGGSHAVFAKPTDRLRAGDIPYETYPVMFPSASGEPVAVVNCGPNYRYVGRLIAGFDAAGILTSTDSASGAYATDPEGVLSTGNVAPNTTVLNIATNLGGIISVKDGNLFGRTTVYLNGLRQFVRTEEANLGDLTADANLWRAQQADPGVSVSVKNGGGIRDSIGAVLGYGGGAAYVPPLANPGVGKEDGQISQLDIENALRFNNGLSLITVTAQQLRDAMEWGVAAVAPGATPGQFPQVSGLWFGFNPTNPPLTYTRLPNGTITGIATPGSRLRSLIAARADGDLDLVVENGVLVGDPSRTFRMVTLGFLADGGDSYFPLTQATSRTNLAPATGNSFAKDGGEQAALASYLAHIQTYRQADLSATWDLRIQNMTARADTVTWPLITRIVPSSGATVHFTTLPGKHYEVWGTSELGSGWSNLTPAPIHGTGALVSFEDSAPGSRRFYQIRRTD
jgi:phosphodiesterase/alkaline phosphatase D-like protein/2',3'-cyclic-nucleotide 2'-phosphodiesterase (5'-nucleotidase family)